MAGEEFDNNYSESSAMEAADANHLSQGRDEAAKQPSRFTEFFLFTSGLASVALGAVLTLAPDAVPQLAGLSAKLAGQGLAPSTLCILGALGFALGMLARVVTQSVSLMNSGQQPELEDSSFMLVADQLATDMAQTRITLHHISSELAELSENNRTLLRNMPDANGQATANHTPMFRLAASVDQLCANVDARLANLGIELNSSIQGVTTSLSQVRGEMQENLAQAAQAARSQETSRAQSAATDAIAAPLPQPTKANPGISLDTQDSRAEFSNPALDIFDKMEERSMGDMDPAAPFGSNQEIDALDDLMPKHSNSPDSNRGA